MWADWLNKLIEAEAFKFELKIADTFTFWNAAAASARRRFAAAPMIYWFYLMQVVTRRGRSEDLDGRWPAHRDALEKNGTINLISARKTS